MATLPVLSKVKASHRRLHISGGSTAGFATEIVTLRTAYVTVFPVVSRDNTVKIAMRNAGLYRRLGALIGYLVAIDGSGVRKSYRPTTVEGA